MTAGARPWREAFRLRRRLLAVAAALTCCLAVAGCGGGQAGGGDGQAGPVPGGIYRFPLQTRIAGITPLDAIDADDQQVAHQVFEGLVRYETRDDGTLATVPCLAESWEVNSDATVFRFTIRKRARFQPPVSRLVTARDVVRSWEIATDPVHPATHADLLSPIVGLDDSGRQLDRRDGLVGVRAIGRSVVRVQLRYPCADFPERLGQLAAAVVPVSYIDVVGRHEFERRPVGTGPFLVERWSSTSVRLIKNPDYWDTGRSAHVQRVHIRVVNGAARQWRQFRAGRIDFSELPAERMRAVSASSQVLSGEWATKYFPTMAVGFVGVDMDDPALGEKAPQGLALRSALALSADRAGVSEVAEGGVPAPVTVLVPPAVSSQDADAGPLSYDPDKAKKDLKGAGVSALITQFWIAPGPESAAVGDVLAAGWLSAGIRASVLPTITSEPPSPSARVPGLAGQQTFLGCWTADYPSPGAYLVPLFWRGSPSVAGAPAVSTMAGRDAPLRALIRQAESTVDDGARAAVWLKAEQRVLKTAACIPLYDVRLLRVVRSSVHDQQLDALGFMDMSRVWIGP